MKKVHAFFISNGQAGSDHDALAPRIITAITAYCKEHGVPMPRQIDHFVKPDYEGMDTNVLMIARWTTGFLGDIKSAVMTEAAAGKSVCFNVFDRFLATMFVIFAKHDTVEQRVPDDIHGLLDLPTHERGEMFLVRFSVEGEQVTVGGAPEEIGKV